MLSVRRPFQARHEVRFGTRELVVLGLALLVIWGLTFVFGMLVGRELAPAPRARTAAPAAPAGRPDPAEPPRKAERPRSDERLTFYHTLTAPTPELPAMPSPKVEERLVPDAPVAKAAPRSDRRAGPPPAPVATRPPAKGPATSAGAAPASPRAAASRVEPGTAGAAGGEPQLWTVQVSSFRSRTLAEELKGRLAAKGFDAYLVSVTTEDGRLRHRIRVGGYPTRAEAERVAGELRGERNLNPFVTTRTR